MLWNLSQHRNPLEVNVEEIVMKEKTIDDISNAQRTIDYHELQLFMHEKLKELYDKDRQTPLFDYEQIRYSAMIDLLHELMPSLKEEQVALTQ